MEDLRNVGVRPQWGFGVWTLATSKRDFVNTRSKSFATALLVAAVGLGPWSTRAEAQKSLWITQRDVAMLPEFCRQHPSVAKEVDPAETARYQKLLGPAPVPVHHYCYGLAFANRAKTSRMTPTERNYTLSKADAEIGYFISNAPADYVLLPEALTKRGEVLLRMRKIREAELSLLRAIETKPDYWPPYAVLSDYYKETGQVDKAREWLEKGIAASSDSRALETRRSELKSKQ